MEAEPSRLREGVQGARLRRKGARAVEQELEPERPREVTGIGPMRASRIVAGWAAQKIIDATMLFLHSHGVATVGRCGSTRPNLGFARAVTRPERWRASRRPAGDEEKAVEQIGRDFPHLPVVE